MASPLPIVVTDSNGKAYTVVGTTSGSQFAAPTPVVLTDVNGNALTLTASSTGTGNIVLANAPTFTGNPIFASSTGTGAVVQATAPTLTGPGVVITAGNSYSGAVCQVTGSGDVEVPVLGIRCDSNSGASSGVALFVENFTNYAASIDLVKFQLHNGSDSAIMLHLVNAGSGNYLNCDSAFTISKAGVITTYNGVATVSNGHPSIVATVDSTLLAASTGTVTLYAVPAAGAGQYRISWNAKITTAGTSPTIGPLTITYTDPDGTACAMIVPSTNSAGTVSSGGNATNSITATGVMIGADMLVNAKASTNIQYSFPVSGTVGTAKWNLHIKCEALL